MQNGFVRTDLADEAHQRSGGSVDGAALSTRRVRGCKVTRLDVLTVAGAKSIGKATGVYYTVELEQFVNRNRESFTDCALAVSELLRELIPQGAGRFLVACLGNRNITPDAVGPCTADSLLVTRHLKSSLPKDFAAFSEVTVLRTGVLGTTGVESADAVKSLCDLVHPDCVLAVDALAGSEIGRLCRSIQLCDSGISPGSGVGNDRQRLDRESLGVPVIALGVPTVVDASAFTDDEAAQGLFVTPRNIDELVRSISKVLAYGVNLALHPGLTVEDVEMMVE